MNLNLLGRFCRIATAVSSQNQSNTCTNNDPNFCYIGEVCSQNYFCPPGSNDLSESNSCGSLVSFAGARERFFCTLDTSNYIFFLNILF